MYEMFEAIFEEVMEELGLTEWWELADGDDFEIVEERITEALGHDCWEDVDFVAWHREMAEDL